MQMVDDGLMVFVGHIEDGLTVFCQERMWANEHVVCVDTQVITAGTHLAAELEQLLEEPSATVSHGSVRPFDFQVDFLGIEAKHRALIDKDQTVFLAEADDLLLRRGNDIDILYWMRHTVAYAFQT